MQLSDSVICSSKAARVFRQSPPCGYKFIYFNIYLLHNVV